MTDADQLQKSLLGARNDDGGWPFGQGRSRRVGSWTEPTALALLALQSMGFSGESRSIAASWLASRQASDGGWSPCHTVPISTWVTSLAFLSLAQEPAHYGACAEGATKWLAGQVYGDPPLQRFLQRTLGIPPSKPPGSAPWFPGTSGWVTPTSLTILALSHALHRSQDSNLAQTIQRAQTYLFTRRCSDGGWNHGGAAYRSENAASYAETTGVALLALHDYKSQPLTPAIQLAEKFLSRPDSVEGQCWLQMGLAAQGKQAVAVPFAGNDANNVREIALRILALAALEGRNPLLPAG